VTTLNKDVVVYSETPYSRAYYNNVIYLFFESFQHGYVYVDVAEKLRACSFINFTQINPEVTLGSSAKDFVRKESVSNF
jgi:hypothetical protein